MTPQERKARIKELEALLEQAYQFISPNHDPSQTTNTEMAAKIRRAVPRSE